MSETGNLPQDWWKAHFLRELPNYLTCLRLVLVPVFVVMMLDPSSLMVWLATGVFIFAAFTDYLDGIIARRFGGVSDVGKLLDPLADKLLVMSALVMLVAQRSDLSAEPWVPGWMVVMVLAREIWVTGLRGVAATKGLVVAAGNAGKVKSVLQMIAIVFLLMHHLRFSFFGIPMTCQVVGLYMLLLSIMFSYYSAVDYSLSVLKAVLPARHAASGEK